MSKIAASLPASKTLRNQSRTAHTLRPNFGRAQPLQHLHAPSCSEIPASPTTEPAANSRTISDLAIALAKNNSITASEAGHASGGFGVHWKLEVKITAPADTVSGTPGCLRAWVGTAYGPFFRE
jgi:hypothetical protein